MEGHHLEAHCQCEYSWSLYVDDTVDPDDLVPECTVCGSSA